MTGALNMVVRMTSDLETYVVAVERIKEYADCPKEVNIYISNIEGGKQIILLFKSFTSCKAERIVIFTRVDLTKPFVSRHHQ